MNRNTGVENALDDPWVRKQSGGYINMGEVVERDVDADEIASAFIEFMKDHLHTTGLYHDRGNKLQNIIKIKSSNGSLTFMSDAHTSAIKKRFPGTLVIVADGGVEFDVPYNSALLSDVGDDLTSEAQGPMSIWGLIKELGRIMLLMYFIFILINQISL